MSGHVDTTISHRLDADIIAALKEGDPSIWTRGQRNLIRIAVAHLIEDEIDIVIGRLRDCLSSAG